MSWLPMVHALSLSLLTTTPEPGWEQKAQVDGITVYTRTKEGSAVREVKATAMIEAPPQEVWKMLRNYPEYKNRMPYTKESLVLKQKEGDRITYFYSIVSAPLVDGRDFLLKITDESDWKDGQGYFKASWTTTTDLNVPERRRLVRMKTNDGYWMLEPKNDGKATWATYYLFTDPGGAIPNFIVNKANTSAIPDIFRAVRKYSGKGSPPG
jgi:hypothetical protein